MQLSEYATILPMLESQRITGELKTLREQIKKLEWAVNAWEPSARSLEAAQAAQTELEKLKRELEIKKNLCCALENGLKEAQAEERAAKEADNRKIAASIYRRQEALGEEINELAEQIEAKCREFYGLRSEMKFPSQVGPGYINTAALAQQTPPAKEPLYLPKCEPMLGDPEDRSFRRLPMMSARQIQF